MGNLPELVTNCLGILAIEDSLSCRVPNAMQPVRPQMPDSSSTLIDSEIPFLLAST